METIRVGIIGAGGITQYGHLPAYKNTPGVEVAAIADINEKKLAYVADKFGVPQKFTDYQEMLEQADIDAVSICTPNYLHREMSINSLNAGKHVLCEKPVAVTGEEAGSLLDIEPQVNTKINTYEAEIAHFVDCIREGKKPLTTPQEIINVAKIIEAVYRSAEQNGQQVKISDL
jgi:predicted dehydrogenase